MKKIIAMLLALCVLLACLAGCVSDEPEIKDTPTPAPEEESVTIRVGGLTGPTGMGMVKLMSDSDAQLTENSYEFSLQSEASAFVPALAKGEIDIAAIPANLASVIYNNTDGGIKLLAINTLGVLYIVERGDTVSSLADLAGKTLYATGEGAAPEYALRYLLDKSGISGDAMPNIQWCSDTTEALSYVSADENAIAMLPQPFVTAAQSKVEGLRVALDLNAAWEDVNGESMVTGVLVVRTEFAEKYPQQLAKFMEEYESSVSFVLDNNEDAAELIAQYGIVAAAPIALKALPACNICFLAGADMKPAMEKYLSALESFNPAAVGGALPADDFYYGA